MTQNTTQNTTLNNDSKSVYENKAIKPQKVVDNLAQLRELYPSASGRSLKKVLHKFEKHSINFIQHSPFVAIATYKDQGGMDVSPRGGPVGFVKVLNESQLLMADMKGNNRLDNLQNMLTTPKIGMLFFIPGVDEALRINGTVQIVLDEDLLELVNDGSKIAQTALLIKADEIYLHCAKAMMRSRLWQQQSQIARSDFPTMGQMLKDQLNDTAPAESQQAMLARYSFDI